MPNPASTEGCLAIYYKGESAMFSPTAPSFSASFLAIVYLVALSR
jgi:hypothetical protein